MAFIPRPLNFIALRVCNLPLESCVMPDEGRAWAESRRFDHPEYDGDPRGGFPAGNELP